MIVVCGAGVTGQATGEAWAARGADVRYWDPPRGITVPQVHADAVVVCVPSPTGDYSIVQQASEDAGRLYPDALIVIRSTLPPGAIRMLDVEPSRLILMPEFLREATAREDAARMDYALFGYLDEEAERRMADMLRELGYEHVRSRSMVNVEPVKLALNTFLAAKVAMSNAIWAMCQESGADYEQVMEEVLRDGRIGEWGTVVPGQHGRGFAGTCLPKDVGWFRWYAEQNEELGYERFLMGDLLAYNEGIRGEG